MKLLDDKPRFFLHVLLCVMGGFGIAALGSRSPVAAFCFAITLITSFYLVAYALEVVATAVISARDKAEAGREALEDELHDARCDIAELERAHLGLVKVVDELKLAVLPRIEPIRMMDQRPVTGHKFVSTVAAVMKRTPLEQTGPIFEPNGDFHADSP